MGNSVSGSKDRHVDDSVDFGSLTPQGVYTGTQDWNQQVVGHLIVDRKLAPFYKPLEEYDESWDDEHILAARKDPTNAASPLPDPPGSASSTSSKFHHHKTPNKTGKEPFRPTEASVYRGAIECPICFLYYPPNINRSRCCDQAICTECFVQIKRAEPTTTHLVSEPASCPYCVQENFGVTYDPPPWRSGLVKDGQTPPTPTRPDMHKINSASSADSSGLKRRKSFGADSPEVVTIDQIRPDWEAKLAAVRAAVTRRANRRIIMRQVGDRLIPIGVSSGRMMEGADGAGNTEGGEGGSGRRRRRNHGGQDLNQILGSVGLGGIGGPDLEELMVMEAMRLSLVEHEEQQRRQNSNNNNTNNNGNSNSSSNNNNNNVSIPSANNSFNTNGTNVSPAPTPNLSPRPSPSSPIDSPPLRPRSPSPAPNDPSQRHSPPRSRFCFSSSPLSNPSPAPPSAQPSLAPPPARTHRRSGSTPDPPSGSTLAAALNAAQTASALLGTGAGARQGPGSGAGPFSSLLPRSAPQTRAASPSLQEERRGGVGGTIRGEPVGGPPSVVVHPSPEGPFGGSLEGKAVVSALSPEVESNANALATGSGLDPLGVSSVSLATPSPASDGVEDASSQDQIGYQALSSSKESSDPLLGWHK